MGKAKSAAVGALAQKRRHFTLGSLTVANRPSKFGKVSQGLSISGPFLNQMIWMLKHTIDKNVLTGQLFFVTNANQMIKYGLNDTIQIKREFLLILYSFTPSDMIFQTIMMGKTTLAKFLSQKSWPVGIFLS